MTFKVEVTVRDGRAGREVDSDGKGQVLARFEKDFPPFNEGDVLVLGEDKVVVIGSEEQIVPNESYRQTIYVGNVPDGPV